jgi:hypothetical protein
LVKLPERVLMKKDAYSYLPATFIVLLLVLTAWLFVTNAGYKETNRRLTLENDSLLSVNQKLQQQVKLRGDADRSLADETSR